MQNDQSALEGPPRYAVAADLGGTNLRVALVNNSGRIIASSQTPTPAEVDPIQFSRRIGEFVSGFLSQNLPQANPIGFGLALAALVNSSDGRILESPNLRFLNDFDIRTLLSTQLQMPVVIENDANAAAIGEHWIGSSRGYASSICFTLGTGVGGGIIINNKLVRGIDGTAGEIGHICVEPNGFACGCGSWGCLEQYASATGIRKILAHSVENGEISADQANVEVEELYEMAKRGDEFVLRIFEGVGEHLGLAAAALVNALNPEAIVIGGGLANAWDLFIGAFESTLKKRTFKRPAERVKILRADLDDFAGVIGAASNIFSMKEASGL